MNGKHEVQENLEMVDTYLRDMFPQMDKLKLTITGGSSFLLKGLKNKFTLDIDTISELDEDVAMFLESFAINNHAREVTVLPSGFNERLVKFEGGFKTLEVYLLSNEDLVISKLGNRCSEDDIQDILDTKILDYVNTEKLEGLAQQLILEKPDFAYKWNYFTNSVLGELVA